MPLVALLNKADKLKSGARSKALAATRRALTGHELLTVITFSAQSGLGHQTLLDALNTHLGHTSAVQA